jgi:hypothetical protein
MQMVLKSALVVCVLVAVVALPSRSNAQPERITSDRASEMAVDEDGRVYWLRSVFAEGGDVPDLRRFHANVTETLLTTAAGVRGLHASAPFAFYLNGNRIVRGFNATEVEIVLDHSARTRPVERDGRLFWARSDSVVSAPADGSRQLTLVARVSSPPVQLAVDDTHVYWLERQPNGNSGVQRAPLNGGSAEIVLGTSMTIGSITLDEQNLYFSTYSSATEEGGGGVFAVEKGALVFRYRTINPERPRGAASGIVVDATHVYWGEHLDSGRFGLRRAPKSGGGSATIAETRSSLRSLGHSRNAVYWADETGIYRVPKADVSVDASLTFIEVTQGLQNLHNAVPLVSGRSTLVRTYATMAGTATQASADVVLHAVRDGDALPGSPLRARRVPLHLPPEIERLTDPAARHRAMRLNLASTAWFVLPREWTDGRVHLRAELVPAEGAFRDPLPTNNAATMEITFTRKEALCLVTVPVIDNSAPGLAFRITDPSFRFSFERFASLYPNADVRVRELPVPFGPVNASADGVHTITWLRPWMVFSDVGSCDDNARRYHVGLVHPRAHTEGDGLALPTQAAWVRMENLNADFDFRSNFMTARSGHTLAHEILHLDWWAHVAGRQRGQSCGEPAHQAFDHGYPYRDGLVDDGSRSFFPRQTDRLHFGWDRIGNHIIPPDDTHDVMTYCDRTWINDSHWREIFNMFGTRATARRESPARLPDLARQLLRPSGDRSSRAPGFRKAAFRVAQLARLPNAQAQAQPGPVTDSEFEGDALYIAGALTKGEVRLGPIMRLPRGFSGKDHLRRIARESQSESKGPSALPPLKLQLLDSAQAVIQETSMTLVSAFDGAQAGMHSFAALVGIPGQTTGARIVDSSGAELWKAPAADQSAVAIASVEVQAQDSRVRVNWRSSGTNTATHLVQYSPDGAQWLTTAINRTGDTLEFDASHLPGGQAARVRVLAASGLSSAMTVSAPFAIATKAPKADIVVPLAGQTFSFGTPVIAAAFAYDAEDGALTGNALRWSIEGLGEIGIGREIVLPELPPGRHRLRLAATDREKRTAEAQREMIVTASSRQIVATDGPAVTVNDARATTPVQRAFHVTAATLEAAPTTFTGPCPARIEFTGTITVASGSGTVRYRFLRNDGASAPIETLQFDGPGSQKVTTTWTLGGSQLPPYAGWQAIEIVEPNPMKSNQASFQVRCQ